MIGLPSPAHKPQTHLFRPSQDAIALHEGQKRGSLLQNPNVMGRRTSPGRSVPRAAFDGILIVSGMF